MSPKHLDRYVSEFSGRHNVRDADTAEQMAEVVAASVGKRLMYQDLIADNDPASGARAEKPPRLDSYPVYCSFEGWQGESDLPQMPDLRWKTCQLVVQRTIMRYLRRSCKPTA